VEDFVGVVGFIALGQDVVNLCAIFVGRGLADQMLEFRILREHRVDHSVDEGTVGLRGRFQRAQACVLRR
jgi:hypothetical protein